MPKLFSKQGLPRLFGSAVVDQALLSAANFAVGLMLIRYSSDQAYGRYVLVQAAVLLLVTAQRAWVIDPLTVLAPKMDAAGQQDMVASIRASLRRFFARLCASLMPLPPLAWAVGALDADIAMLVLATLLAGWAMLEREYLRGVLMLYYRPETVLGADALFAGVLLVAVAAALWLPVAVAVGAALAIALAAAAGAWPAMRSLARDPGWRAGSAAEYWRRMRPLGTWATVGALLYWVLGQGWNYIVVFKLDTTAVAEINAIRLLLMPAFLLTIGIKALMLPMAMRWLGQAGYTFLLKRLTQFLCVLALLDGVYFLFLWFTGEWLLINVLDKTIANYRVMIALWSLLALINMVRDLYLTALLVRQRFRNTAGLVAATAALSVTVMWFALDHAGAWGALIGLAAGELLFLAGTLWLVLRERRLRLDGEGDAPRAGA